MTNIFLGVVLLSSVECCVFTTDSAELSGVRF